MEWLAFNAFYGERLGGGAVCPLRRGVASSEAEIGYLLEGRSATLERGGPEGDPRARRRSFRGFEGNVNGPHAGLL